MARAFKSALVARALSEVVGLVVGATWKAEMAAMREAKIASFMVGGLLGAV